MTLHSVYKSGNKPRICDAGFLFSAVMALALWALMPELDPLDFTLFWKAAASLAHGSNPYISTTGDSVSLNSPLGLGLLWFIGAFPYQIAKQTYVIAMYFAFLWSIWVGYKVFFTFLPDRPSFNIALLLISIPLGMFFQVMVWGSMVIVALIGISAFYCLDAEESPFLAGCCLGLCLVKPHLFILVFVWIAWQTIARRQLLLSFGLGLVALVAGLSALYLQPDIFEMYLHLYSNGLPSYAMTNAALGNILYSLTGEQQIAVLFAPLIAALCALPFINRAGRSRDLRMSFVLLLPWSVLLSAYCWGHDYLICFATVFVSGSLFRESIVMERPGLALLSGTAFFLLFVVGNVFSPGFKSTWSFVFYGVSLAAASVLAGCVNRQLKFGYRLKPSVEHSPYPDSKS